MFQHAPPGYLRGELRPGGSEREWCDPEVLRRLRRASLASLRATGTEPFWGAVIDGRYRVLRRSVLTLIVFIGLLSGLLVIPKIAHTPDGFPRRPGVAKKRPLA